MLVASRICRVTRQVAARSCLARRAPRTAPARFFATQKSSSDVLDELIFETESAVKPTVAQTTSGAAVRQTVPPRNGEAAAHKSNIRVSMKKLRPLTRLIAKMPIDMAITQMALSRQRVARIVRSTLASVKKNAINTHGMDASKLHISRIVLGPALRIKRVRFHAKGRIGFITKPSCHLSVFVKEVADADAKKFPRRSTIVSSSHTLARNLLSSTSPSS